jgi:3,4-dihydroxy 2-butanone 4-phosphate synthase/GTP cyclohydrolase II
VFPLRAHPLGVLGRPGHTEAAVDLARLAGLQPSGALCEIVGDDGEPARGEALLRFARAHALPAITIADLVAHRRRTEQLVDLLASARLPTRHGEFTIHTFRSRLDGIEHVALVRGAWSEHEPVLARIHSECLTGDVFGSARCDCGSQLELALERVAEAGAGVVVYVRGHEGRGIGLTSKLHAYQLQDDGRDTVQANEDLGLPADARSYTEAAHILRALGAHQVRLLTNNPRKVGALQLLGVSVLERVPLHAAVTAESRAYLRAKRDKLGHLLHPAPLLEPA